MGWIPHDSMVFAVNVEFSPEIDRVAFEELAFGELVGNGPCRHPLADEGPLFPPPAP